ncbi:hypothetical protein [Candidatus Uabimicrobium sp. HlEnr_7]|uniref:hypothetical protein n=1 Tax=Candidatus Uabimicrobium helgolandensis TaxID=3095367 RepID=UPI0035565449
MKMLFFYLLVSILVCENSNLDINVFSKITKKSIDNTIVRIDGQAFNPNKNYSPGVYNIVIYSPGYYAIETTVIIKEKTKTKIEEFLLPKERLILIEDPSRSCVMSTINGKQLSYNQLFVPEKKYHLVIKYQGLKTINKHFLLPVGEGPFFATNKIDFVYLKSYRIIIDKKYKCVYFYVNKDKICSHQIFKTEIFGSFVYEIFLENPKSIKVISDFYYDIRVFKHNLVFEDLRYIDGKLLIDKIDSMSPTIARSFLNKLKRNNHRKLLNLKKKYQKIISSYIGSLK